MVAECAVAILATQGTSHAGLSQAVAAITNAYFGEDVINSVSIYGLPTKLSRSFLLHKSDWKADDNQIFLGGKTKTSHMNAEPVDRGMFEAMERAFCGVVDSQSDYGRRLYCVLVAIAHEFGGYLDNLSPWCWSDDGSYPVFTSDPSKEICEPSVETPAS